MRIKNDGFKSILPPFLRTKTRLLTLGFAVAIFCVGFVTGVIMHKTGLFGTTIKPFLKRPVASVVNYVLSRNVKPEKLIIDIKYKNAQKIEYKRLEAIDKGVLITSDADFVPARITLDGKTYDVKIRLKGDLTDQMLTERWPLRVIVKGDETILGMKRFSLHIPEARDFLTEWFFHQAMKRERVIALRYYFVNVVINGKDLGIYALEESFEKRLIEDNQRREGPIIGFSEDLDIARIGQFGMEKNKRADIYEERINLYSQTKTFETPNLKKAFIMAKNQLESFRRGKRSVCEVFDCTLLARYFAVIDLFNAGHAAKYGDFKLYLNPITSKLEPIAFDAETGDDPTGLERNGTMAENWASDTHDGWRLIFGDREFFSLYMKELDRLSGSDYVKNFLPGIETELKSNLRIIHRSYPWYQFNQGFLYGNQDYIRKVLDPPMALQANFNGVQSENGKKSIDIMVGNITPFPLKIISLSVGNVDVYPAQDDADIGPRATGGPLARKIVHFDLPEGFSWEEELIQQLKINYTLFGIDKRRGETVDPWSDLDQDFAAKSFILQPGNAAKFSFLNIDEALKEIHFKQGSWVLDEPMVVPAGYKLIAYPGLRIDLQKGAVILSHAPVIFQGSEEKPIIVESTDGKGQGLVVINPEGPSILKYVIFRRLTEPVQQDMRLTGAVTFYNADLHIKDCQFTDIRAEDNLNVIRSQIKMERTTFQNTLSDAFDSDFSRGTISDSFFSKTGNDAIDVSGSRFEVSHVVCKEIGDKCISAGENSQVRASDIEMDDVSVGLASKDKSELRADRVKIDKAVIGFTAYQKKPEYGPGKIWVNDFTGKDIKDLTVLEEGSTIVINGQNQKALERGLYHKLYGDEKSPTLIHGVNH